MSLSQTSFAPRSSRTWGSRGFESSKRNGVFWSGFLITRTSVLEPVTVRMTTSPFPGSASGFSGREEDDGEGKEGDSERRSRTMAVPTAATIRTSRIDRFIALRTRQGVQEPLGVLVGVGALFGCDIPA